MLYGENSQCFQAFDLIWDLAEFVPTEVENFQLGETKDLHDCK